MAYQRTIILNSVDSDDNRKAILTLKSENETVAGEIKLYNFDERMGSLALGISVRDNVVKVPVQFINHRCSFKTKKYIDLDERLTCALVDVNGMSYPQVVLGGTTSANRNFDVVEVAFSDDIINSEVKAPARGNKTPARENQECVQEEVPAHEKNNKAPEQINTEENMHDKKEECLKAVEKALEPPCEPADRIVKEKPEGNAIRDSLKKDEVITDENAIKDGANKSAASETSTKDETKKNGSAELKNNIKRYFCVKERGASETTPAERQQDENDNKNQNENILQNTEQSNDETAQNNNKIKFSESGKAALREEIFDLYEQQDERELENIIEKEFYSDIVNESCLNCKYKQAFYSADVELINEYTSTVLMEGDNSKSALKSQDNNKKDGGNTDLLKGNKKDTENEGESENFYGQIKTQIDDMFKKNSKDDVLENIIPNSKWAKVNNEDGESFYVLGLIYEEDLPRYIAYGIPAENKNFPPKDLKEYAQWVPVDTKKPDAAGYWMVYQDAASGESIVLEVV